MTDLRPRAVKKRKLPLLVAAGLALLIALTAFLFRSQIRDIADQITGLEYSGQGLSNVTLIITQGETGEDIAKNLVELGVTKDLSVTLRKIYAANPIFYPGAYQLPTQISSSRAIEIISNPKNISVERVTIREGLRASKVFSLLSEKTGISVADFETASSDLSHFGLPKSAVNIEGWLFPATYDFQPNLSAIEILDIMVARTKEQLVNDGVAKKNWQKTLILASIVQSEARLTEDFYKVSRTFKNRLAIGMPLQSDATVNYGVGSEDIYTSDAERADPNGYNTYKYPGLPIGPIAGAGALAIDAVLNPAQGDWLYFCTVNLKTGETVFSTTYAEHLKAVAQWLKWMKENPGWDD